MWRGRYAVLVNRSGSWKAGAGGVGGDLSSLEGQRGCVERPGAAEE